MNLAERNRSNDSWTIGSLLTWTTDFLRQHGAEQPRLDAEVLLAHARRCTRIELYTAFGEVAPSEVRDVFRDLVRQRADGRPVAYLVGHREFYSMSFRVTPDVLIPRPETEFLIVALLDRVGPDSADRAWRLADVGTGSGILAVCAACQLPQARVTAIDVSEPALRVARENAAQHGVTDRIRFLQSDLFEQVEDEATFDFILSNPPYVRASEMPVLAREVRDNEPRIALEAGETGLEIIERLLTQAKARLVPSGGLILEISPTIHAEARERLERDPAWSEVETVRDLAGHPRVLIARRPAAG